MKSAFECTGLSAAVPLGQAATLRRFILVSGTALLILTFAGWRLA
jgi:hypothetical protein